jgi:hypothetical protein
MHQMCISTNFKVSEVVFGYPKPIVKTVKEPKKILCQDIEPNPPKDRALHEGDNPSF